MLKRLLRQEITDWTSRDKREKERSTWIPWKLKQARAFFIFRMDCFGRRKEWLDAVEAEKEKRRQAGQNPSWDAASRRVMRTMGYLGTRGEYDLYREWKKQFGETELAQQIRRERAEIMAEQQLADFESAVATLPSKAQPSVELDWIQAHPAMARKSRMKANSTVPVLLTVDDILYSSVGPAPSKSAVYALQHWANHPAEFYKQLLGEQKKKTDGGDDDPMEKAEAMRIDEMSKLLKQMGGKA